MEKRSLSPISDQEDARTMSEGLADQNENSLLHPGSLFNKQDLAELFEVQKQALLASQIAAVVNSAAAAGYFSGQLPYVPGMQQHLASLFPPAGVIQTQPLSLKVDRSGGSPPCGGPNRNPLSGSSGTTNQVSPSTSSTDPEQEPEDLSMSLNPSPPNGSSNQGSSGQQNWSFEEQFKQLYELSDDEKRKEFLDSLFSFMQKRGTPVTRIPIMAKQVLDLYELYRLVVANGGLVEVINKKLWREITKGLNLPSSITSAAFTLRTQYMKYLYPYECEKEQMSSPAELQAAIDGNRREGRRSGFSPYAPMTPSFGTGRHGHINANGMLSDFLDEDGLGHPAFAAAYREQALAIEAAQRELERTQSAFRNVVDQSPAQNNQNNNNHLRSASGRASTSSLETGQSSPSPKPVSAVSGAAAAKRHARMDQDGGAAGLHPFIQNGGSIPSAHIKIANLGDGTGRVTNDSNYLVVSMDINGIAYQGILCAPSLAKLPAVSP